MKKMFILPLILLFTFAFMHLASAGTSENLANASNDPVQKEQAACTWESNNGPSLCLVMQNDQENFPGKLLVLAAQGIKGQGGSEVEDFSIEVRPQEMGGNDDFVTLQSPTGAGDFKAVEISDLPCGTILLRAVIGVTPDTPEGTGQSGAIPYRHICPASSAK